MPQPENLPDERDPREELTDRVYERAQAADIAITRQGVADILQFARDEQN